MTAQPMPFALTLGAVSFVIAVIWGPPLIRLLRKWRIGKQIRVELPTTHQTKMGTPTMGGLMILVPLMIITVVMNLANFLSGFDTGKAILAYFNFEEGSTLIGKSILLPLLVLTAFGVLGAVDDLSARRLMTAFYRSYASGAPKAAALRAAMLEEMSRRPHPYYWAPFMLVGEA